MSEHYDFGKRAEDAACNFLEAKNYQILERNFRYLKAEVDIIARLENTLVIIEVKARSDNHFINPEEAVNKKKIKLIVNATDAFMQNGNRTEEVRFDIISILRQKDGKLLAEHIENAFEAFDAG